MPNHALSTLCLNMPNMAEAAVIINPKNAGWAAPKEFTAGKSRRGRFTKKSKTPTMHLCIRLNRAA